MILLHKNCESSPSILSQVTTFVRSLVTSSSQSSLKTSIDLRGPNQVVREHRQGFTPIFLQKDREQSFSHLRKKLLKKRYFFIINQTQHLSQKKPKYSNKMIPFQKSSEIQELQKGIRKANRLIISKNRSKIFQQDFFNLQNLAKYHQEKDNENSVKKGQLIGKIGKTQDKVNEKQIQGVLDKKQVCQKSQNQGQKKQVINLVKVQTPQKDEKNEGNPFLALTTKKLSFMDLICQNEGEKTKKKMYERMNEEKQTSQIKWTQQTTINQNNQNNSFFQLQQQAKQSQVNFNYATSNPINSFNMFPNFNSQHQFTQNSLNQAPIFGSKEQYQQSAAMFMAAPCNNQSLLFEDPCHKKTNTSKDRSRKKKGPTRVYQQ